MASKNRSAAYKRNQVDWALWHLIDRGRLTTAEPPALLIHQIKRLIDVDRKLGVEPQGNGWKQRYAFLSGPPQGTGGENAYRLEEVISLWIGLQLLHLGLPQLEIIQFLRALKPRLDRAVGEIIEPYLDAIAVMARNRSGDQARKLRTGDFLEHAKHVYIAAEEVSARGVEALSRGHAESVASNICIGRAELLRFIENHVSRSKRLVVLEIANALLSLVYFLSMTPPKRRGRIKA